MTRQRKYLITAALVMQDVVSKHGVGEVIDRMDGYLAVYVRLRSFGLASRKCAAICIAFLAGRRYDRLNSGCLNRSLFRQKTGPHIFVFVNAAIELIMPTYSEMRTTI